MTFSLPCGVSRASVPAVWRAAAKHAASPGLPRLPTLEAMGLTFGRHKRLRHSSLPGAPGPGPAPIIFVGANLLVAMENVGAVAGDGWGPRVNYISVAFGSSLA